MYTIVSICICQIHENYEVRVEDGTENVLLDTTKTALGHRDFANIQKGPQ